MCRKTNIFLRAGEGRRKHLRICTRDKLSMKRSVAEIRRDLSVTDDYVQTVKENVKREKKR